MSYQRWVIAAISLFGIGVAIGLSTPAGTADLFAEDLSALKELGRWLTPYSVDMAIFIFAKNVMALVMSFILSPLFCLVPVMALIVNGGVIALVSSMVVSEKSLGFLIAGLVPHGIFELPALIMGEAAALSFGTMVIVALFKKERRQLLLPNLKQNLRYLAVALALLVPAAVVETYITPLFLAR